MQKKRIFLDYVPFPQARPRIFYHKGSTTKKRFPTTFDPSASKKRDLTVLIKAQWPYPVIEGPVNLEINFHMPIPKSTSKKKRLALIGTEHIKKPDIDNLLVGVLNSMTEIVFTDDRLIYEIHSKKFYAERPGIEIIVHQT